MSRPPFDPKPALAFLACAMLIATLLAWKAVIHAQYADAEVFRLRCDLASAGVIPEKPKAECP